MMVLVYDKRTYVKLRKTFRLKKRVLLECAAG